MTSGSKIWTIPNILSLARIGLVPLFIYFIVRHQAQEGFIVFLIAGATDGLDGFIARTFHQKSALGAFLDPAGDKLLMAASFILLSVSSLGYTHTIPVWLTACVFGRDLLIVSASFILLRFTDTPREEIHVTILGKVTTLFQMGVLLLVLFLNWRGIPWEPIRWLYMLTFGITVLSGIHYTARGIHLLQPSKKKHTDAP
ncbi:MAG: CDP-alcohol phosphatidyltransferase family protein [Candidatus Aminicenantes bacterium]|nr:CDP-alcohol phosphatidyltransferase family protein [Candidatus Aminicenantes bacterium]